MFIGGEDHKEDHEEEILQGVDVFYSNVEKHEEYDGLNILKAVVEHLVEV